jgi:hypothetical protein
MVPGSCRLVGCYGATKSNSRSVNWGSSRPMAVNPIVNIGTASQRVRRAGDSSSVTAVAQASNVTISQCCCLHCAKPSRSASAPRSPAKEALPSAAHQGGCLARYPATPRMGPTVNDAVGDVVRHDGYEQECARATGGNPYGRGDAADHGSCEHPEAEVAREITQRGAGVVGDFGQAADKDSKKNGGDGASEDDPSGPRRCQGARAHSATPLASGLHFGLST